MQLWRVRDVMSTDVVRVSGETPVVQAVRLMDARRVRTVPVVDKTDRVVGVVSRTDLVPAVPTAATNGGPGGHGGRGCVSEWMSVPAWTVDADASLSVAGQRMYLREVKQLPVTGDGGQLVGIVSATDLLRVFGRLDTAIRRDVVEEVLRDTVHIDPEAVHVAVENGTVTLAGIVDRRRTAAALERLTHTVPGVVSVVNRLHYEYDDTPFPDDGDALVGTRTSGPHADRAVDPLWWDSPWIPASAR